MNYFLPSTWENPETEKVLSDLLTPFYQSTSYDKKTSSYQSRGIGEVHTFSVFWEIESPYTIEFSVTEPSHHLFSLYINYPFNDEMKELIKSIGDMVGVPLFFLAYKNAQFPMEISLADNGPAHLVKPLAKSMFFLGCPLEDFVSLNLTRHEEMEWTLEQREFWKPLWHLRPDSLLSYELP